MNANIDQNKWVVEYPWYDQLCRYKGTEEECKRYRAFLRSAMAVTSTRLYLEDKWPAQLPLFTGAPRATPSGEPATKPEEQGRRYAEWIMANNRTKAHVFWPTGKQAGRTREGRANHAMRVALRRYTQDVLEVPVSNDDYVYDKKRLILDNTEF